jgi:hypothetical protein
MAGNTRSEIGRIADAQPGITYPRLTEATGRCPPEDVGGPWGYREFLEAIADPDHEQHAGSLTWVGGSFDPSVVDVAHHARSIAALAKRWSGSLPAGRKRNT